MLSKASFDLDAQNNPIVKLEIASTPDVRDKIAKRFIESLRHESTWCQILPNSESEYIIWPILPDEFRKHAEWLLARADELDKRHPSPAVTPV